MYSACANFAGSIAHSASKRLLLDAWTATDLPNVGMASNRIVYRLLPAFDVAPPGNGCDRVFQVAARLDSAGIPVTKETKEFVEASAVERGVLFSMESCRCIVLQTFPGGTVIAHSRHEMAA